MPGGHGGFRSVKHTNKTAPPPTFTLKELGFYYFEILPEEVVRKSLKDADIIILNLGKYKVNCRHRKYKQQEKVSTV